jgi:hypothetical protein
LIGGRLRHLSEANFPNKDLTDQIMNSLPSSSVATLRGRVVEWFRVKNETFFRPARVHLAVAASLLICFISLFAVFQMDAQPVETYIAIKHNSVNREVRLPYTFTVNSEKGEFFEFPDGSLAYATKGTVFYVDSYQQGSSDKHVGTDRRIQLIMGELFFDVQPANEGFNVICANAKTTVFGTQFYVGTQPGSNRFTVVAVREGQVFVEKIGKNQLGSTRLKADQGTRIVTRDGNVTLMPPVIMRPMNTLMQRLNAFNLARSDRKVRSLLSKPGVNVMDGVIVDVDEKE